LAEPGDESDIEAIAAISEQAGPGEELVDDLDDEEARADRLVGVIVGVERVAPVGELGGVVEAATVGVGFRRRSAVEVDLLAVAEGVRVAVGVAVELACRQAATGAAAALRESGPALPCMR
jgi:hypothetical protein